MTKTFTEHYSDYGWIRVKRCPGYDVNLSALENYTKLEEHHTKETTFLIAEVRRLASLLDERDQRLAELRKELGKADTGDA